MSNSVEDFKNSVKDWLKSSNNNREWLAEQCGVKKSAVDEWFKKRREIPTQCAIIIRKLMEGHTPTLPQEAHNEQEVILQFDDDEWAIITSFKEHFPNKSIENYCREKALEFCIGMSNTAEKSHPTGTNIIVGLVTPEEKPA